MLLQILLAAYLHNRPAVRMPDHGATECNRGWHWSDFFYYVSNNSSEFSFMELSQMMSASSNCSCCPGFSQQLPTTLWRNWQRKYVNWCETIRTLVLHSFPCLQVTRDSIGFWTGEVRMILNWKISPNGENFILLIQSFTKLHWSSSSRQSVSLMTNPNSFSLYAFTKCMRGYNVQQAKFLIHSYTGMKRRKSCLTGQTLGVLNRNTAPGLGHS